MVEKNSAAPGQESTGKMISASTEMMIGDYKLSLKLVVPTEEILPEALVPALRELTNQVVEDVEEGAESHGYPISCKKGCGACCRQYVPISPSEARLMANMVEEMPEPRRSNIKQRFADAVQQFMTSEVVDRAMNYSGLAEDERRGMVRDYFQLGIACPFLEDESCSIHPQRPLICREYLVTSSPEHCASLDRGKIMRLKLPVSVAETFSSMEGVRRVGKDPCFPLILALEWAANDPNQPVLFPGPKWVQYFFEDLSGKKIPEPDSRPESGPDDQEFIRQ